MTENSGGSRRRIVVWLLGALVLLAVAAAVWGVTSFQGDLSERAEAALDAAGIDVEGVRFEGRDAYIGEVYGSSEDRARALDVVAGVSGVRSVSFEDQTQIAAPETTTTSAPSATTTSDPPATTTTTAVTSVTEAPAPATAHLEAGLKEGALTLTGVLPDAEVAGQIGFVADLIYGPFVTNEIAVDAGLEPASWVPGAVGAISVLPIVGEAELTVQGQDAVIAGVAGSPEKAGLLAGALQQALGPDVALISEVDVTGETPPFYLATAPGDGTLNLEGVMPDQAVLDLIAGAAVDVYGADNVGNEMVVAEGIESTFSLYRLPLTFAQFAPFPQWEVRIENDVITGALRGGASFATASAVLTPELRTLLDTAAGILLRNPSLGLVVEGHTDSRGSSESNQTLSEARAQSAVDYLIAAGIDSGRLVPIGFGETQPTASNETAEGRAQNRRVEFSLGPPGGTQP